MSELDVNGNGVLDAADIEAALAAAKADRAAGREPSDEARNEVYDLIAPYFGLGSCPFHNSTSAILDEVAVKREEGFPEDALAEMSRFQLTEEQLEFQADTYREAAQMLIEGYFDVNAKAVRAEMAARSEADWDQEVRENTKRSSFHPHTIKLEDVVVTAEDIQNLKALRAEWLDQVEMLQEAFPNGVDMQNVDMDDVCKAIAPNYKATLQMNFDVRPVAERQ